ncbi:DUF4232 domain-containing protein [Streptomyces sp. NBC_00503]|uniref:DUF4232 domain-containing protein n=1 Tax=Streptomyces sp. NBC_00503 TaxID=2903659 RepID=UPI002E7FB741|nr:DUF4232 domain-containing protein [Streptomyces sp. NBC_00503]WUD80147.1 DUF4232 domain-containing protein [Streptomyces sp. NBC_00503]
MTGTVRTGTGRGGASRTRLAAGAMACGLLLAAGTGAGASAQETAWLRGSTAPCTSERLIADGAERIGASQVRITVVNDGPGACVLRGFPTVALAGQGSPDRNEPLTVTPQGRAHPVRLAAGDRASTRLTFAPVLGEAGGYCPSGAEPTIAPSIVLGVGGGGLQLAPDDGGQFALCGTTVRATAFTAAAAVP